MKNLSFLLISFFIILSIILSLFSPCIWAGGFYLKTIGALDVEGSNYSHYWYTNNNVTFTGSAIQNSQINIAIDGQTNTIEADGSGNWIYPTRLSDGDHQINFSSNGSNIFFVLTIGKNIPENVGQIVKSQTPTVGNITPTITLTTIGVISLIFNFFLKKVFLDHRG